VFGNDVGITYEGRYVNNHFLPDPHQLNEDSYDVDIELIGTKENKVLVHQIFELVLTLRPELALAIRGLHAEVRMVAQGAAIKPPDETAAKVADKPEPPPQSIEDKPQSS
jgi:hypothetical protein